jgi:hypothetical protein
MLDHYLHHPDDMNRFQHDVQYQLSSLDPEVDAHQDDGNDADNDDDDDMQLGDEADAGLSEHMSDDDGHVSHSFNVSPTAEDDDNEPPELIDQKPLTTPPFSPPTNYREPLDLRQGYQVNNTYNRTDFSAVSNEPNMDDDPPLRSTSTKHASPPQRIVRITPVSIRSGLTAFSCFKNNNNRNDGTVAQTTRSSASDVHHDQISSSNFGSIIQSWLRDTVQLETDRRPTSHHTRPWSKSVRPWSLDKLQRDIERFNRLRDFGNAIEASKKMLKNGILGQYRFDDPASIILPSLFLRLSQPRRTYY